MADLADLTRPKRESAKRLCSGPVAPSLAAEARAIASAVRRIGRGRGASPESMLIQKHDAADRLLALASRLEVAR
ncbi:MULTISPECIES: hypothetical protein [Xanthobacter]|uniref:hypothetical protein n=1 Tax=Xanthobacter TaxID=279 RepID=UPI0037279A3D